MKGFEVVVLDDFSNGRRENLSQHLGKADFCLVEVLIFLCGFVDVSAEFLIYIYIKFVYAEPQAGDIWELCGFK